MLRLPKINSDLMHWYRKRALTFLIFGPSIVVGVTLWRVVIKLLG